MPVAAPADDPSRLTAVAARALIASGELSAAALARACARRLAQRDGLVRAWAAHDPEAAIAAAEALDRAGIAGLLHGIPVGVKDVIDTADLPTRFNSPRFESHRPARDADCVALLRQAGAIIFGKTATVEFGAGGRKAPTRNPRDLDCTPGGSSSGSAAAVADGHVPIALGTQSAGSVIRPAAYCGVFAMKPSWGLVGRGGVLPYAPSLDTIGWMARSVADLALVAEVFGIGPPKPAKPVRELRLGLCRIASWPLAEPAMAAALARVAAELRGAGAEVVDLALPEAFAGLVAARRTIALAEGHASFRAEAALAGPALHPGLRELVEGGARVPAALRREAYDLAAACRARFDALTEPFDAILTPSAAGEAPRGLASTGGTEFNEAWTLLHVPCVTVPAATGPRGLPLGLTLTGPRFSDAQVLAAAATVARALGEGAASR